MIIGIALGTKLRSKIRSAFRKLLPRLHLLQLADRNLYTIGPPHEFIHTEAILPRIYKKRNKERLNKNVQAFFCGFLHIVDANNEGDGDAGGPGS